MDTADGIDDRRIHPDMPRDEREELVRKLDEYSNELSNGCVIWTGPTNTQGYPVITLQSGREQVRRVVYDLHHKEPCGENTIKTICRNALCISTAHLVKTEVQKGGKIGRFGRKKYPWAVWFRKKRFQLVKGKDYTCTSQTMRLMVYNAAKKYDKTVTIENKDTLINIVVHEKESKK